MTGSRRRRWLSRVGLIVVATSLLSACASGAELDSLDPAGPDARRIDNLITPVYIIAGLVLLFVSAVTIYAMYRYRASRYAPSDFPEQLHGNTKLEIGWTIVPAIILAGVAVFTVAEIQNLNDFSEEDSLDVVVVGNQWWWEYRYDLDGDGEAEIVTANDLVIPAGEPVSLSIESRDVVHSFWIPRLNGKRDAVPGRSHPLLLQADHPGVYRGQCTEFCGLSHAYMRMRVVALDPAEYAEWEAAQQEGARVPSSELAQEGMEIFRSTCSSCHLVRGEGGNEDIFDGAALVAGAAPDLTHFASRGSFAGAMFDLYEDLDGNGEIDTDEIGEKMNYADLKAWLKDAPGQKPMSPDDGRGMPNLNLSDAQVDALVAYLETLE